VTGVLVALFVLWVVAHFGFVHYTRKNDPYQPPQVSTYGPEGDPHRMLFPFDPEEESE
jgi:hypothetical protein